MEKIPGIRIDMGGATRIVPPLNLNALMAMQERLAKFEGGIDAESVKTVVDAAYAALKRNYPDITREEVGEEIDIANMQDVFQAIMDVSGLKRKSLISGGDELGEAKAASQ